MIQFHRMPFLRILIFLAGGILIQQHTNTVVLNSQVLFALLLSTITFLLIFYQFWRRVYSLRWIPGFAIATLFLIIGLILSNHQTPQKLTTAVATKGVGIITTVEYRNNHRIRITLKPEAYQQPTPLRKKDQLLLMVQGPLDMIPQEGDRLFFNGEIRPLPTPTNPEAFDYGQYLHNNGFSGQAYFYPKDIVIEPSKQFDYRFLPTKIRNQCLIIFQNSGLSEPGLTIVQALLLGDRTALDPEIQDSFIRSGAIHLLAVSGLHVGIIYILLGGFLSLFFKPSNVISILLSLGFLFSYAFITGFSPSVSRAALMFAVIHMGRVTNRNTNIYNSLAVSATLLLIINPLFLYHVGFWLSHLAVLGIVAFYPYINSLFTFRFIIWRQLWSLIAVSLAAQITTLPVSLYTFGAFPTWFLLSNILMLPLIAPALILAIATLLFSFSPTLSSIFAGGLNDLLQFMVEMAETIERLPNGYLEYLWFSFPLIIIYYLAIHQIGQLCHRRSGKYWIGLIAALIALAGGLNIQLYYKLNLEQVVVYDTRQGLLIDIIQKGQILTLESEELNQQAKSYARNAYIKRHRKHNQPSHILTLRNDSFPEIHEIKLGSQNFLVINGEGKGTIVPSIAYQSDVVVLSGHININLNQLIEKTNCKTIVAASNCPYPLIQKWKKESEKRLVTFHSVKEQGAFLSTNRSK